MGRWWFGMKRKCETDYLVVKCPKCNRGTIIRRITDGFGGLSIDAFDECEHYAVTTMYFNPNLFSIPVGVMVVWDEKRLK